MQLNYSASTASVDGHPLLDSPTLQKVTQSPETFLAGLFDFSIGSIPSPNRTVSVLIIKLEYQVNESVETKYLLYHVPPNVLDLSRLACTTVAVSVGLVTREGDFGFSNATTVCVHGGKKDA